MKNETYFKVGQRVGSFHNGDGVVSVINPYMEYPLFVEFDNGNKGRYTFDGKNHATDMHPTISQQTGVEPIINTPIWEPKDGEFVWCNIYPNSNSYNCLPFKCFDESGKCVVYADQQLDDMSVSIVVTDIHPFNKPPFIK